MRIALVKKLADAARLHPEKSTQEYDPLYSWTASWSKVSPSHRAQSLLFLVNEATKFTVGIYQVRRKDLGKLPEMILPAIRNTLLALNMNREAVDAYLAKAPEVAFAANEGQKEAPWLRQSSQMLTFYLACRYNAAKKMFTDDFAAAFNNEYVSNPDRSSESRLIIPRNIMFEAVAADTGLPAYKYRAFEILVSLDLGIYTATRRLVVPAGITFPQLHHVLQQSFGWGNIHMHGWHVFDAHSDKPAASLLPESEAEEAGGHAVPEGSHTLSEYFPKYPLLLYIYDFSDCWQHAVEFVREIEDCGFESPFLSEAEGQTPPEDVGGIDGFIEFREIMLDPDAAGHEEMKQWVGHWSPELEAYRKRPHVIRYPISISGSNW